MKVEGSEFRSLRRLEMLMLHGNDITTISPGAFYSLRSLQVESVCLRVLCFSLLAWPLSDKTKAFNVVLAFTKQASYI